MKRPALVLLLACSATRLIAQTGGPGQPEFMQFKPANASNLVDLSSGSFSYNIPLFVIGGYPCNLSYRSGAQMDEVASTVGLGWNLNIGAITHQMRGIPDDFRGDPITREVRMKPNITMGGNMDLGLEIVGFPVGFNSGTGVSYNNYNGFALERSFGLSFSASNSSNTMAASLGLGMKANSQSGVDLYAQPSVSLKSSKDNALSANGSLGGVISVNSQEGLKASVNASMSLSMNVNYPNQTISWQKNKTTDPSKDHKTMSENLASFAASYSFSKSAEIPRVSYPFKTTTYAGSIKVGGEVYFLHPNATVRGYFTKQELSTNTINTPAYGFLYSEHAVNAGENVLLDYNTEKDVPYVKDVSKNIGIPFYTNDVYSVNAQGIGGSFQLNRNDVGVIFNNRVLSSNTSLNIGLEAGIGNAFHVGADLSTTSVSSSTGKWSTTTTDSLRFRPASLNNVFQPAYFKNASDVSVDANDFYTKLKGENAVEVELYQSGATSVGMRDYLVDRYGSKAYTTPALTKPIRDPRTINIQYLTADEASKSALDKKIRIYGVNTFDCRAAGYADSLTRTAAFRKPWHISEMTATNTDGMRYVFGLPVYNLTQEEVSYTLEKDVVPDAMGLVPYNPGTNWGTNGKDGFYEKTLTPAYVTTNLLTAVLSPDYIDVDGNGPSINDAGNYVKFNYTYAGNYKWRTPYAANKATFNKALLSDPADNKGSFVYGEKEEWFIHSIESKTEVAEFYYDTNRLDALGAIDNKRLYRLREIRVYSKNERILNSANAQAIRVIRFTQDYSLCPGTKNSLATTKGKLTLKQVGMYSGKSMRELQSPYRFSYGAIAVGDTINPSYDPRQVNRWGNYQKNSNPDIVSSPGTTGLSNADFPYASQDATAMNRNAYSWNLTGIRLPGGGAISVNYEAHRYAYVQDQRAMEMMKIDGFASSPTGVPGAALYNAMGDKLYLKFTLKAPLTGPTATRQLLYNYFNSTAVPADGLPQYFYYKMLVQLRAGRPTWEWVSGYFKIQDAGLSDPLHAWVKLKPVCVNDRSENACPILVNPLAKNAFQFMRMNRPGLAYGNTEAEPLDANLSLEQFLKLSDLNTKLADQVTAFTSGFNTYARNGSFANNVPAGKSFIRLYSPGQDKLIGGSRVKRVTTSDHWKELTSGSGTTKTYTTDYEYTELVKNPVTNQDQAISSGVTEYEPMVGIDENPLRQPEFYDQHIKLAPDNNLYVDLPYNESLFPGPNLIYSKVKVTANKTNLQVPGTGYQVHEFFTAKDYPVKTDHTEIGDNFEKKTSVLQGLTSSILGFGEFHDYVTLSQGFSITLNDMHGKAKATRNYNSQDALVSSEESEYALNKNLRLVKSDGSVYTSNQLGISVSAICDSRTTEHSTQMLGIDLNLDFTILSVVPSFLLVPLPKATIETTRLNSVSFNKIITLKGIPVKKTVTENGAAVSTENVLFDEKTGNPLLTRTTNEFSDPLYSFHYPAGWIYSGLSAGYVSADATFAVNGNSVPATNTALYQALNEGDELVNDSGNRLWITAKTGSAVTVQPKIAGGPIVNGTYKVLRPGRRNLIAEEAGTVTTNYYPVLNGKLSFVTSADSTSGMLNASMKQYAGNRVKPCDCDAVKAPASDAPQAAPAINPYATGERGNWYPLNTWAWLTGRTRGNGMSGEQTNLRKDGLFKTYNSFFNPPLTANGSWTLNTAGWQTVETVTLKDVNGLTLETRDALDRYNASLAGYKQMMIVAQAGNAMLQEILYDGFEDRDYLPYANACDKTVLCEPQQINWNNALTPVATEAHSGKYAGELSGRQATTYISNRKAGCTLFSPLAGKKYVVSAWVKESGNALAYTYSDPAISIGNTTFKPSGPIIDGWQRIHGEFTIPSNLSASGFLSFSRGANQTFFDDIRVYPADGKMSTYVYDRNTLKLTFSSDENNYFTRYNYDGENNLQSINKETEQGVQTVQEGRSGVSKNE